MTTAGLLGIIGLTAFATWLVCVLASARMHREDTARVTRLELALSAVCDLYVHRIRRSQIAHTTMLPFETPDETAALDAAFDLLRGDDLLLPAEYHRIRWDADSVPLADLAAYIEHVLT